MIITKDFHSMIEMNKYIEDNNIKSKDIYYMGNFLNIKAYCLAIAVEPLKFSLQYEDNMKSTTSCVDSMLENIKWNSRSLVDFDVLEEKMCKKFKREVGNLCVFDSYVDSWRDANFKDTFYIKVGFQTILVLVQTWIGEDVTISTSNIGTVSVSEIVKVLKNFQKKYNNKLIFSLEPGESKFKKYLQEYGIDNVVIANKKKWENIMEMVNEMEKSEQSDNEWPGKATNS